MKSDCQELTLSRFLGLLGVRCDICVVCECEIGKEDYFDFWVNLHPNNYIKPRFDEIKPIESLYFITYDM